MKEKLTELFMWTITGIVLITVALTTYYIKNQIDLNKEEQSLIINKTYNE